jgi:hypothetical protein
MPIELRRQLIQLQLDSREVLRDRWAEHWKKLRG